MQNLTEIPKTKVIAKQETSRKLLNLAKDIDLKSKAQPKVRTGARSFYGSLQMDLHRCPKMRVGPLGLISDR